MNTGKNRFGRAVALLLLIGVVYGVRSIARGGLMCPTNRGSCCSMPR